MPNDIAVLDQLAQPDSKAKLFLKRRHAEALSAAKHIVWLIPGKLARKTSLFGRTEADEKIFAGRPFALRGLSCEVGPELARAVRMDESKDWGSAMLAQIKMRLEVPADAGLRD